MNWWKKATSLDNDERNRINIRIRRLESVSDSLKYASQLIHMTNRGAKNMVSQMINFKVLSSYQGILSLLKQADKIALDSPSKFATICQTVAQKIDELILELTEERENMFKTKLDLQKGLIDE